MFLTTIYSIRQITKRLYNTAPDTGFCCVTELKSCSLWNSDVTIHTF